MEAFKNSKHFWCIGEKTGYGGNYPPPLENTRVEAIKTIEISKFNSLTPTVAMHIITAIKHPITREG